VRRIAAAVGAARRTDSVGRRIAGAAARRMGPSVAVRILHNSAAVPVGRKAHRAGAHNRPAEEEAPDTRRSRKTAEAEALDTPRHRKAAEGEAPGTRLHRTTAGVPRTAEEPSTDRTGPKLRSTGPGPAGAGPDIDCCCCYCSTYCSNLVDEAALPLTCFI
jgi:hypothetical protein